MIKLRLKRFGKKREASFRLVATNSTSRRDGRPLEELGFYNPRTKETRLDTEAIRARLSQGAQPTDTVRYLLEKGGLIEKTIRPAEGWVSASRLRPATPLPPRPSRPKRKPRQRRPQQLPRPPLPLPKPPPLPLRSRGPRPKPPRPDPHPSL